MKRGGNRCRFPMLLDVDREWLTRLVQGTVAPGLATADAGAARYEFRAVKVRRQRKGKRQ